MNRSLIPLAGLYGAGTRLREHAFHKGWIQSRRLSRPVVSVGNLTVGGSGKTPLVAEIAQILIRRGYKPAILTRGYGRERGPDLIVLEPNPARSPDRRAVGDEPALLARALPQVPILICGNRHRAGLIGEQRFGVDVHILDDGFQHFALNRDVDLVAIDVTQDLAHEALLPAGRLREPVSALTRADMIVLTRVEIQDTVAMEKQVIRINSKAPLFRCTTRLRGLVGLDGQRKAEIDEYHGKPICAFCAIGNPSAFFSDLRRWGFNPTAEVAFPDHHAYSAEDIDRLNHTANKKGATAFVTTQKDVMNLPPHPQFELPALACAIQAEISDIEKFEQLLLAGLERKQLGSKVGAAR